MTWKKRLLTFLDVTLRVPPLIVMDLILNKTFMIFLTPYEDNTMPAFILGMILFVILVCFIASVVIFTLSTKQICDTYCFLTSLVVLWLSYTVNSRLIRLFDVQSPLTAAVKTSQFTLNSRYEILLCVSVGLLQIVFAFAFNILRLDLPYSRTFIHTVGYYNLQKAMRAASYTAFLQPVLSLALSLPPVYVTHSPVIALLVGAELLVYIAYKSLPVAMVFIQAYRSSRSVIRTYGIQTFFEAHWIRLHVPNVLRIFFLTRTLYSLTHLLALRVHSNARDPAAATYLSLNDTYNVTKEFLTSSCETTVALMGMTSAISYGANLLGAAISLYVGNDSDEHRNLGTVSAILFFILALQTGLTALDAEQRLVRLYRNFCLLLTTVLHYIHSMVHPLLMTLSASHNRRRARHARVLSACAALLVLATWFLVYLWRTHDVTTWLLAVTVFSVEVIVKVTVSLLIYTLFLVGTHSDWQRLDDYVYYIKATGNTIEFVFGIFLFANGAYIMLFEMGGSIRAIMMCIHAYFNIWVQAQEGWHTFIKRRSAVKKINSLPLATAEQLRELNDVCGICYQELLSARITRCSHYFHSDCLRKWLYVLDKCPLCHTPVHAAEQQQTAALHQHQD